MKASARSLLLPSWCTDGYCVGSAQQGTGYKIKLIGVAEKWNGLSLMIIPGLWFNMTLETKDWEGTEAPTKPITRAVNYPSGIAMAYWEAPIKLQEMNKTCLEAVCQDLWEFKICYFLVVGYCNTVLTWDWGFVQGHICLYMENQWMLKQFRQMEELVMHLWTQCFLAGSLRSNFCIIYRFLGL